MPEFTFPHAGLTARVINDEDAPSAADFLSRSLNSDWLVNTVLVTHQFEEREICIRDHINLVLTLEYPNRKLVSFIFAELEAKNKLARLHVIYTLRGYRHGGHAASLLVGFDKLIQDSGYEKVMLVPTSEISQSLFGEHAKKSELQYDIYDRTKEQLRAEKANELR